LIKVKNNETKKVTANIQEDGTTKILKQPTKILNIKLKGITKDSIKFILFNQKQYNRFNTKYRMKTNIVVTLLKQNIIENASNPRNDADNDAVK
jgi:hypothetical protein